MARKNRIVVENASYHVTTRIAHQAFLLGDAKLKDLIVHWIYGIADFSGITVLSWNVMDNHLHLYLDSPSVPERYWCRPDGAASAAGGPGSDPSPCAPATSRAGNVPSEGPLPSTFSMRPAENRAPRWMPDLADLESSRAAGSPLAITPAGDSPSEEAIRRSLADGVPVAMIPRPATGFMLSDEEMLGRLRRLYAFTATDVDKIASRWELMRQSGSGCLVDREKEAYCRRMYNISQFMKTLKQRISQYVNSVTGHSGQLWEGRFHSALVDHEEYAAKLVSSYIELNAARARIVRHPSEWRWCSFAAACSDGPYAERARTAYERLLGCPWEEAKSRLESIFAERLPEGYDPRRDGVVFETANRDGVTERRPLTIGQLVKTNLGRFLRDGFISRRPEFKAEVMARFHAKFPYCEREARVLFAGYTRVA